MRGEELITRKERERGKEWGRGDEERGKTSRKERKNIGEMRGEY